MLIANGNTLIAQWHWHLVSHNHPRVNTWASRLIAVPLTSCKREKSSLMLM